jgi:excisionase family DNA binding protein
MITIPLNTNTSIQIPAWTPPEKPERKQTEDIPPVGTSIRQAVKRLGIGKPQVKRLIKTGEIRSAKLGRRVVVSVKSLNEFIDGKTASDDGITNPISVSIPKAAKMLTIGIPLVVRLIKTGEIRTVKTGKRVVVSVQSLHELINGKTIPAIRRKKATNCRVKKNRQSIYPPAARLLFPEDAVTSGQIAWVAEKKGEE